jgi:uncharacterized protein
VKKVILDTNIIISALISPKGTPGKILTLALQKRFRLVSSEHLLAELSRALRYERVTDALARARKGWTEKDTAEFIRNIRKVCSIVPSKPLSETVCKDPDDDWLLSCAVQSGASIIVSGDKNLTDLVKYRRTRIMEARAFLDELTSKNSQV